MPEEATPILTFKPIERNSMSAPFLLVPKGGFMTTVSIRKPAPSWSFLQPNG